MSDTSAFKSPIKRKFSYLEERERERERERENQWPFPYTSYVN